MKDSYINTIQNKRSKNEDRFISIPLSENTLELCFVIDGCGDANGVGDVVITHLLKTVPIISELDLQQLEALFVELNNCVCEYRKYSILGSYVGTMAVIDRKNKTIRIAHVGDTRAYLLHNQSLFKITEDHSAVGMLEDAGMITEDAAKRHPNRHMVLQSCGRDIHYAGDGFVFLNELTYSEGERFVIMTDGVYDPLYMADIVDIMNNSTDPETCVNELFRQATEKGSTDNATAAVYFL